ncbi:uncharacterized protein YjaZ [Bacillus oleivorans]|uniref:Uncharacterized protein YjaZ n=1 Tax=Bacillus oleivorans TaxID=1448271 RepID=A0A285D4V9_9BACI|nr:DUF2268 domain-containing putative Zn-dependent protease [Bacillus oleivorans]SNX74193.1 uncharacterized protein YjaZ [Bacillus oleivorans]
MAVIQTDKWYENADANFDNILEKLPFKSHSISINELENILLTHGLHPNFNSGKNLIKILQNKEIWRLIKFYYQKYKRIWKGPDIPIYILPMNTRSRSLMRDTNGKSGVAFPEALYLFLSDQPTKKEIEALFVHEYHHACRFQAIKNKVPYLTLLDSLVMEGLAEHAVLEYCGKNYIAKWSRMYSEDQLKYWWKRWFYPNLSTRREKKLHDLLLYGRKMFPTMVGYSVGFFLISEFRKEENFSTKAFIGEPAETFLLDLD